MREVIDFTVLLSEKNSFQTFTAIHAYSHPYCFRWTHEGDK